ncbi:MAG: ATP-binding cassette domain-containing protein [Enterocloster asparagiformis]|nr:ATP-binding cassette domain-containing protein [Enterocloster asparagiformis]
MVTVSGIIKRYGAKNVLDGVSADFPTEKLVAFIGSNGAGKSTLLSIITRTLQKNEGIVQVDGKSIDQWKNKELARQLSVLKQSNHLTIRIKVRELVAFGRFPYSQGNLTREDEAKIDEAIAYTGLEELRERYMDELSGGQRQMAYIAMVIAQDTKYIFLDEPLNNLDMKHSVQIMAILRRLVRERNKTVMVVIHDINFVSHYADYIVAMKDGKIIAGGDVEEMMNSRMLEKVYGMDIEVQTIHNRKVCLYYSA